jgi:predicted ATPase
MSNKFIRSLTIENFKSIKRLQNFELHNINILIGSNGAGKSNFLSFFSFFRNLVHGELSRYVTKKGRADGILTFGRKHSESLKFALTFSELDCFLPQWSFELSWTDDNQLYITGLNIFENDARSLRLDGGLLDFDFRQIEISELDNGSVKLIKETAFKIDKIFQYHFHDVGDSSPIKSDCIIVNNDKLLFDGKNIAPFLRRLKLDYYDSYQVIIKIIRAVVPDFYDFHFRDDLKSDDLITLLWINKNDRDSILHPRMLSDGSLRFICLATVLLQPLELMPEIVIIDEPELGLHPQALALIASLVQRLSLQKQFIIATQSSNFIDLFEAHDIVVVNKNLDGSSEFVRLDDDELSNWLDEYSLADLWDMNIIGGRP